MSTHNLNFGAVHLHIVHNANINPAIGALIYDSYTGYEIGSCEWSYDVTEQVQNILKIARKMPNGLLGEKLRNFL